MSASPMLGSTAMICARTWFWKARNWFAQFVQVETWFPKSGGFSAESQKGIIVVDSEPPGFVLLTLHYCETRLLN